MPRSAPARQAGWRAWSVASKSIAGAYDPALAVTVFLPDGRAIELGRDGRSIAGPLRSILDRGERVMLNFVTHLSGIATLTARYVAAVAGHESQKFMTRARRFPACAPGWPNTPSSAAAGSTTGWASTMSVLIKDNHLGGAD